MGCSNSTMSVFASFAKMPTCSKGSSPFADAIAFFMKKNECVSREGKEGSKTVFHVCAKSSAVTGEPSDQKVSLKWKVYVFLSGDTSYDFAWAQLKLPSGSSFINPSKSIACN